MARPCDPYTLERVEELFAGRKSVNAEDVAAMEIPIRDRIWAVLRLFVSEENLCVFTWDTRRRRILYLMSVGLYNGDASAREEMTSIKAGILANPFAAAYYAATIGYGDAKSLGAAKREREWQLARAVELAVERPGK